VYSKQYPKHKHFSFKTKNGIHVAGRVFRIGWSRFRLWLIHRDKNGKRIAQHFDFSSITVPKSFPNPWTQWVTTSSIEQIPMIIAHHVVNNSMPKTYFNGKFIHPKK
jgi:hypothetical protein